MSERYIAAVEISSSKIIAAVGKSSAEGQLDVIAVEEENDVECVRYGIIQNLEETSVKVARMISKLEKNPAVAPRKIKGVFVGLSGRSLRSITAEVSINLPADTEITEDIITRLRAEAMRQVNDSSLEVVDAVPRTYRVGQTETHSPKGAVGNSIQATFDLIVCRPELKRNLYRTLTDKLGISVTGFVVTALATGHLILTADEKRLGCMLVDMGAETTTVTIYRKGSMRYFVTLPMGGRNITRDITSLSVLEERAEQMKITSGNAMGLDSPGLNMNGVNLSDMNNLVVARSEEIVANILEQLEYAGLKETDLPGGIICIGGGAKLRGMLDLLQAQSGLPVRMAQFPPYVELEESAAANKNLIQVVSVLYAGATLSGAECLEIPDSSDLPVTGTVPEEEPAEPEQPSGEKTNRFLRSLRRRMETLFGNPDDDSEIME